MDDEIGPSTVTLSRSEGSVALGVEMLRGVYPERSEGAQHDKAATHTASWINLSNCIIGSYEYPGSFIKLHNEVEPGPTSRIVASRNFSTLLVTGTNWHWPGVARCRS